MDVCCSEILVYIFCSSADSYFKILPFFVMVIPGMVSRVLYTEEIGCILPEKCMDFCGSEKGCSNLAYPKLVLGIMPEGTIFLFGKLFYNNMVLL